MKTIEERVTEWVDAMFGSGETEGQKCFIAGAKSEHAELTRWNDPEEVMPPRNRNVLVKYAMDASHKDYITIGCYNGHAWDLEVGNFAYVVAWREIH